MITLEPCIDYERQSCLMDTKLLRNSTQTLAHDKGVSFNCTQAVLTVLLMFKFACAAE